MKIIAAIALYIGVVDSVNDKYAYVEITTSEEIIFTSMPVAMFPCEIKEGDMFYFEQIDGVTEIRCGEPE
jgi:hypothetical protein